jgi:hypothetical protein
MSNRPSIPDNIKLKLWVLSGGRCEFPGCNQYVWKDGLTLKEDNFAHMAHIIAANPSGPRGDEFLSSEQAVDFNNLMLVCLLHSKLIDGKHQTEYSLEDLQRYKQAHEDRIRRQTELQPEMTTTVLRFMANIGDRAVQVGLPQAHSAILPRFPADDRGILMDYTNRPGRGAADYWTSFATEITAQVGRDLAAGNDRPRPDHISVFALGPIPLLIHMGRAIGNSVSADIYQRHRDTEDWKWKPETEEAFEYQVRELPGEDEKNIAVVLSLSGKIHEEEVYRLFKQKPHLYEIFIDTPNPGFLTRSSQLQKFRETYRGLLSQIRDRHGGDVMLHLFPAIPAPVAVVCGRELLPKADPAMTVYDHERDQGGFQQILTIY